MRSGLIWISVGLAGTAWAGPETVDAPTRIKPPVVLVLPLEGEVLGDRDLGYAVASEAARLLLDSHSVQLFHPLQLYPLVAHHRARLDGYAPEARAKATGELAGADWVLSGRVEHPATGLSLILTRTSVLEVEARSQTLEAPDLPALLALLPRRLSDLFPGGPAEALGGLSEAARGGPSTKAQALLELAACERALAHQALGLRTPAVLDLAALGEAERRCRAALRADPRLGRAQASLSLIAALRGERAAALQAKRAAPADATNTILAELYLARAPTEVVSRLQRAVQEAPEALWWLEWLGEAQLALGDDAGAQQSLEQLHTASRRQPRILLRLGELAARHQEHEEALEWTERALRLLPEDPDATLAMAARLAGAGQLDEARLTLDRWLGAGVPGVLAHLERGSLALSAGETGRAETELEAVLQAEAGPERWQARGEARYGLAFLWSKAGQWERAQDALAAAASEGYFDQAGLASFGKRLTAALRQRLAARAKDAARPTFVSPFGVEASTGRAGSSAAKGNRARF